ncbi:basic phospholipase A2 BFPA isoform X1 [Hydra vulgaris]|uniref:basic phospholipase A2 BFPA isoform X1 n=1 Tax=Hydra vulgaris TaxID=6087 RepID=UPI0002B46B9E|nr:basic phospholipase A2 BFPA [Hydra vulgaris]
MHFVQNFLTFVALINFSNGGLNELCELIDFYSKKEFFHCFAYDEYGCWCGPGGSGKPVDKADGCCKRHDHCYDRILSKKECNPYIAQYSFDKDKCLNENGTCLREICECDQAISKCLSKQNYNRKFYGYRLLHKC